MNTRGLRTVAIVGCIASVTSCGGNTTGTAGPTTSPLAATAPARASTAANSSSTTSLSTDATTTAQQANTTSIARPTSAPPQTAPPAINILPSDAVLIDCNDYPSIVVMRSRPPESESTEVVYSANAEISAHEQGLKLRGDGCSARTQFSSDFSKRILHLYTDAGVEHVGYVDLTTGSVVDVTALRQGSGFSNSTLSERVIGFATEAGRERMLNAIVFEDSFGMHMVRLDDPATVLPVEHDAYYSASGFDNYHSSTLISPDGTMVASEGYVAPYGGDRWDNGPDCSLDKVLGWLDGTHAVYLGDDRVQLVDISAGSPITCADVLPPNDRSIVDARLRFDRQAVYIDVSGASGVEQYEVDLTKPASEPQPANAKPFDTSLRLFFPADDG